MPTVYGYSPQDENYEVNLPFYDSDSPRLRLQTFRISLVEETQDKTPMRQSIFVPGQCLVCFDVDVYGLFDESWICEFFVVFSNLAMSSKRFPLGCNKVHFLFRTLPNKVFIFLDTL